MALRQPPAGLVPPSEIPVPAERWEAYDCELVTPLYGGGVTAGEVDEQMPVRASAIRGQLRFWWRLLARHKWKLGNADEIRKKEFALWGGVGNEVRASRVWLRIDRPSPATMECAASYPDQGQGVRSYPDWQSWANGYALFPAQGKVERGQLVVFPKALAMPGLTWQTRLALEPDCSAEDRLQVRDALRWWASFGGLGARTRRGLGAVRIAGLERVGVEEASQAGCRLVIAPTSRPTALLAWQASVDKLRDFRQGVGTGRSAGEGNRPGRSFWPEPASIRAATGTHRIKQGGISFAPVAGTPPIYPRASFGLPIVFHFQGEGTDQQRDPADVILEPGEVNGRRIERMASPLILRPCPGQPNQWHAAALLLPERLSHTAVLALRRGKNQLAQGRLSTDRDLESASLNPRNPMLGRSADALEAFLIHFAGHGQGRSR
jgi:CRISPR-associated protein Cmr1